MTVKRSLSFSHSANNQFCNLAELLHLSGSLFLRVKKTCWYISLCFLFITKSTAFIFQGVWHPKRPEIVFPTRWGGLLENLGTLRCGFGNGHSTLCDIPCAFQCSDKSCLRTPSLKKRVSDANLEGKKDSGMLKYIRLQVLAPGSETVREPWQAEGSSYSIC